MSEPILQFFEYAHLPDNLAIVSKQFHALAHELVKNLPRNPERSVALRKLVEAKDAAVRAAIFKDMVVAPLGTGEIEVDGHVRNKETGQILRKS